jgi:hypothetical protein
VGELCCRWVRKVFVVSGMGEEEMGGMLGRRAVVVVVVLVSGLML